MLPVTAWKGEHCYLLKVLISAQKPISCLGANFYWILKVKQNWTASASPRPMIRQNEIRPIVNHSRFPALIVVFFSLLWYLIGSLEYLSFSSLSTLVLIPRQPVKERSTRDKITKLKVQHVWIYMQNGKLFLDIIQEHDHSTAVILHLSKMFPQGENCDKKNV